MSALAELFLSVLPDALAQLFFRNSEDNKGEESIVPPPAKADDDSHRTDGLK